MKKAVGLARQSNPNRMNGAHPMIPRPTPPKQIELHGPRLIEQRLADACDVLLCEIVHLARYQRLLGITTPSILAATKHVSRAIQSIDDARRLLVPEGDE